MSHQTGIRANEALLHFFGICRDGKVRAFKVSIDNEQLVLSKHMDTDGTWEKDYDRCVPHLVEPEQPCYILYRFDSKNETGGFDWLLISWSPDDSHIRQKMLYASTKATLKQEFGSGQIKEEIHATAHEDATLSGLRKTRQAAKSPAPLTTREEELASLSQDLTEVSIDSRTQTLGGVAFPLHSAGITAIQELSAGNCDYVQLKIDMNNEEILLVKTDTVSVSRLPSLVPSDAARYHLYCFKHTHECDYLESIVFIYSMPGYSCTIKERMLYSSCKAPLLDFIENSIGLKVEKKLEIDSGSELTEEFLQDELHPKRNLHRPKFEKPKGPPNRGAKRLTKLQQ
uniref:Twinfilin n=1 Tax=Graphocephala atropunctata TaxID=36148 RepID=A0A1B6LI65_9HEMI